jgi:hypothetical protein
MFIIQKYLSWGLSLFFCMVSFLMASQTSLAQERKPAAELIALAGTAEIKSPGDTQFRPAKIKDAIYQQDQFRTLANSRAKLFFQDESILVLSDNTTIDIATFQMTPQGERQSALMKIIQGSLRFIVSKARPLDKPNFEIQGTTAVMGIRGTDGVFETRSPDVIYFLSGRSTLSVRNMTTGQSLNLTPGNFISAISGQPLRSGIITPEMRQRLIGSFQIAQRITAPQTVTQPPPPSEDLQAKLQQQRGGQQEEMLGNPLISQTNQFNNTLTPGSQGGGGGGVLAPLPTIHRPLIPSR